MKTTAWMFCRECEKFDEDGTGLCTGVPCDFETEDPPCENYIFDDSKRIEQCDAKI